MMKSIKRLSLRRDIGDKPVPCTYFTRMISTCVVAAEGSEEPQDE
jgi:hypothetical protein